MDDIELNERYFELKPSNKPTKFEATVTTINRINEDYQLTKKIYNGTVMIAQFVESNSDTLLICYSYYKMARVFI